MSFVDKLNDPANNALLIAGAYGLALAAMGLAALRRGIIARRNLYVVPPGSAGTVFVTGDKVRIDFSPAPEAIPEATTPGRIDWTLADAGMLVEAMDEARRRGMIPKARSPSETLASDATQSEIRRLREDFTTLRHDVTSAAHDLSRRIDAKADR